MSWSISVKTVGNTNSSSNSNSTTSTSDSQSSSNTQHQPQPQQPNQQQQQTNQQQQLPPPLIIQNPKDFTILVEPNDGMSILHSKIEAVTGLKSSQQRLIYRGRLISSGSTSTSASTSTSTSTRDSEQSPSNDNESHDHAVNEEASSSSNDNDNDSTTSHNTAPTTPTPKTPISNEFRICDVVGLSDGQTIHLVPRPLHTSPNSKSNNDHTSTANNTNTNTNTNSESNTSTEDGASTEDHNASSNPTSGPAGAGLLAALLGLGSSNTSNTSNNSNNNNEDNTEELEAALSMPRIRSTRNSSRRRFANSHRRTANDSLYPDPCPLEPVRQGLMTLHTMLGDTDTNTNTNVTANTDIIAENNHGENDGHGHDRDRHRDSRPCNYQPQRKSPLNVRRKWYVGQWLDCRDTVNQWLEATVVEVINPHDILVSVPKEEEPISLSVSSSILNHNHHTNTNTTNNCITVPYTDPAIGANDLEGRKKLLLEPSDDETDQTLFLLNDNDEDLIGYQERSHNQHIQLLKIHYNGWPHRWDEWIRSDSERIRPFRTRSRNVPGRHCVNPLPQSVFHAAPSTHVVSEDDEVDRLEVLPELCRAIDTVQNLFMGALQLEDPHGHGNKHGHVEDDYDDASANTVIPLTEEQQSELSSMMKELHQEKVDGVLTIVQGDNDDCGKSLDVADIVVEELEIETQHKLYNFLHPVIPMAKNHESHHGHGHGSSDSLLPWKEGIHHSDRDEIDEDEHDAEVKSRIDSRLHTIHKQKLEALAPLLDRLGRVLVDFAPHVASIAEALPDPPIEEAVEEQPNNETLDLVEEEESEEDSTEGRSSPRVSLRPLWSSRDTSDSIPLLSPNAANSPPRETESVEIDPDYVDFVNGFINPPRPDNSPNRRVTRRSTNDSFGSSLLSAFLASTAGGSSDDTNDEGNGPRIVRLGSGGTGGGGNGNGGIDIHIHAIVTGPNGAMAGVGDLDGLVGLMSPPSNTLPTTTNNDSGIDTSMTRPSNVINDDDEDELGLFSDLYAEGGAQSSNTDSASIPFDTEIEDDEEEEHVDNVPSLLGDDEADVVTSNSMDSASLPHDTRNINAPRPSSSRSTSSTGSRRGSQMLGRIFRRALNRRNGSNNS